MIWVKNEKHDGEVVNMNDIEFTDLRNSIERAVFILSSNDYDKEAEKLSDMMVKIKKDIYV